MKTIRITLSVILALLFLCSYSPAKAAENKGKEIQEPSKQGIEQAKVTQPASQITQSEAQVRAKGSTPKAASFILVTDVIDAIGGQRYNGGCDLSIFAGGQSSAIGSGTSTNFNLYAGFVYPAVVKCGDANGDGKLSVSDVVYLINYLFKGGPGPKPYEAAEVNCDRKISVSDVVYLINYLFKGGPQPIC